MSDDSRRITGISFKPLTDRLDRIEAAVVELIEDKLGTPCNGAPDGRPHCYHPHPFLAEIMPVCCWCNEPAFGEGDGLHGPYRPEP